MHLGYLPSLLGGNQNHPCLSVHFLSQLFHRSVIHAPGLAGLNANRHFTHCHTIFTEIAKLGDHRHIGPFPFIFIYFPGADFGELDTKLSLFQIEMFLARYLTAVAAGAKAIINENAIRFSIIIICHV